MSATVLSVKDVVSKYNNTPAIRLDLLTPKGIKSKTININSRDYKLLNFKYGDIHSLKDKEVKIDLVASKYKSNWFNVYFTR